jgi:DNA-binding transcriptional ArsR family regulator
VRARPRPPKPELQRRPARAFGWLDAGLLHERYLMRLGPDGTAVLTLLAIAADRTGASFYGRCRMAEMLGMTPDRVDVGLERLRDLGLVEFRPWRTGGRDGVWQLMPTPRSRSTRSGEPVAIATLLRSLGIDDPRRE